MTRRTNTISRVVEIMFPLFGIWPGKSCVLISRTFWIFTAVFVEFCHYRYFITHLNPENFYDLMDCLSSFLAHGKVISKLVVFWINQRKLMESLALMTDDWNDRANDDVALRVMMSKAKTSDCITNTILILHTISIITYATKIFFYDIDLTDKTIEVPHINKIDIPFAVNTQYLYKFLLIAEYVHLILSVWGSGITNVILLTLVLHAGGQMDILRDGLMELAPKEIGDEQKSIVPMANRIIQEHNKIIDFCERIEALYTHVALVLFASNTIMICSLAFIIVAAVGTPDAMEQIIKSLLFYAITNLEAFMFCYAGEYLNNKSKTVGFAAYNCAWYNLKPRDSRILLFIILRSQRQLTLTAGKMMDLSLESFSSIMNASGSYLSVLLAKQ